MIRVVIEIMIGIYLFYEGKKHNLIGIWAGTFGVLALTFSSKDHYIIWFCQEKAVTTFD